MNSCPCCKKEQISSFIEPYSINSSIFTSKSKRTYEFFHKPFFCEDCGHIFNGTPPNINFLTYYYGDKVAHIAEDFDIDKRIGWIKEFSKPKIGQLLLDFGSNARRGFHETLDEQGFKVTTYDLSTDTEVPKGKFDIITSYFVLEHIVDLDKVFVEFALASNIGTKLIIEVPSVEIYHKDYSGLLYEHQQHFQETSLEALCSRHGYQKIKSCQEYCSRSFGFVAAFEFIGKKDNKNFPIFNDVRSQYIKGRASQALGESNYPIEFINRNKIKSYKIIIFWGINANYESLIRYLDKKRYEIYAIDINIRKKEYLNENVIFFDPEDFLNNYKLSLLDFDNNADNACLIITASEHYLSILKQLNGKKENILIYEPTKTIDAKI